MADLPAKSEIGVTTGAIRGSKKIHVAANEDASVRVAMREIHLEGGEPPVRVYDTSGTIPTPMPISILWPVCPPCAATGLQAAAMWKNIRGGR